MERTRVAKVDDVILARRGDQVRGTLHLTPHHLIFVHSPPSQHGDSKPSRPRELWITYPIISFCTLRPSPTISRQPSSIRLRCRDFTFVCFYIQDERKARDAYESIKAWTCKLGRIEKLYAFAYQPQGPEKDLIPSGWSVYNPMREWRRMGVGEPGKASSWRISRINVDYGFSPSYPALLPVPSSISDNTLNYAGRYRSRARIPALTYLHPVNNCTITRCSQPMVGVRGNRSIQDEKLLAAIFSTTRSERPLSNVKSPTPEREESGSSKESSSYNPAGDLQETSTEAIEDAVIAKLRGDADDDVTGGGGGAAADGDPRRRMVYGAQQRNMIVDARPTINAIAMQAAGMGSENMDNYKFATKVYLGIDNIHVMRESLQKVVDALKDSDVTPLGPNRDQLHKSHWIKHISNMLDGVSLIARQVGLQHSHVLIHCSDGWDRTSQLSALGQICLDPYYRTLEGFIVLVEKDWLSFGHMFRYRSGFLNSEKWFQIENERISGRTEEPDGGGGKKGSGDAMSGAQKTFENAFLSAKGFFTKHNNDSRESINVESENEVDAESRGEQTRKVAPLVTKVKETAPIFHQFLDATFQLMYQHPTRFEFNERFLRRLLYHLYSCQYGTFLFDNERERTEANLPEHTRSVWDYFLARRKEFINPNYDATVDDNVRGKERLIFPRTQETRWWASVFGRTDEEMNGSANPSIAHESSNMSDSVEIDSSSPTQPRSAPGSRPRSPVLTGVETSEAAIGVASPPSSMKTETIHSAIEANATPARDTSADDVPHQSDSVAKTSSRLQKHPNTDGRADETERPVQDVVGQADVPSTSLPADVQEPISRDQQEEVIASLADDLDPLGIGDVKDLNDRAPTKAALTKTKPPRRQREQVETLMQ